MKATKVRCRKTGEIYFAEYAHNLKGNLRYWVCGKFYSDKLFDKAFEIIRTSIYILSIFLFTSCGSININKTYSGIAAQQTTTKKDKTFLSILTCTFTLNFYIFTKYFNY